MGYIKINSPENISELVGDQEDLMKSCNDAMLVFHFYTETPDMQHKNEALWLCRGFVETMLHAHGVCATFIGPEFQLLLQVGFDHQLNMLVNITNKAFDKYLNLLVGDQERLQKLRRMFIEILILSQEVEFTE